MLTNLARTELGGRRLFHFTSLNLERLAQVVQDSKIYFSRPAEFNDPFELSPYVNMDTLENKDDRERWLNTYAEAVKNTRGDAALAQVQPHIEAARADVKAAKDLLGALPASLVSVLQRKYRVYCLSTRWESVQMWSHYGAKHQGVAFEFSSLGPFFGGAFRVNYTEVATAIDPDVTVGEDLFVHGLLTKAAPWRSEDEFRLLATDEEGEEAFIHSTSGLVSFPPGELTAIYLGCRMPEACVRAVVSEAMNRDDPLPVRRMVRDPRRLALTPEQIFPEG